MLFLLSMLNKEILLIISPKKWQAIVKEPHLSFVRTDDEIYFQGM